MNGCSKALCPLQIGCTDYCKLTEKECPYFTAISGYQEMDDKIKGEVAREIFGELEKKARPINRITNHGEPIKWDMLPAVLIKRSDFEGLKKKYIHNNPSTPPDIDVNH